MKIYVYKTRDCMGTPTSVCRSSPSWTDITSSSLDNNYYRIYDTSILFPYNNAEYYNSNFIKFYDDSYDYKIRVVDENDSTMFGEKVILVTTKWDMSYDY